MWQENHVLITEINKALLNRAKKKKTIKKSGRTYR